jgi:hypothetical protein
MHLIGTKQIRVGLHKTVCKLTWCKDAAAGRPIGDDRADDLERRSLRGRLGGDNPKAKQYRADPEAYLKDKAKQDDGSRHESNAPSRHESNASLNVPSEQPQTKPPEGGGASPGKESRKQKLEKVLEGAHDDERRTAVIDELLEKRPDDAVRWTTQQIDELRRNPKVVNAIATFLWRVENGRHIAPPKPQDHDGGQTIREQNTLLMHANHAADPSHQRRVILSMRRGDRLSPDRIAAELRIELLQVLQVLSEEGLSIEDPQNTLPAFLHPQRATATA